MSVLHVVPSPSWISLSCQKKKKKNVRGCSLAQVWCEFDAISALVHWHRAVNFSPVLISWSESVRVSVCLSPTVSLPACVVRVCTVCTIQRGYSPTSLKVSICVSVSDSFPACVRVCACFVNCLIQIVSLSVLVLWTACTIQIVSVSVRFKPSQCLYLRSVCEHEEKSAVR